MLWELYGRDLGGKDAAGAADELQLTGFQRDGVQRLLRLLEVNGGVLVADEVGLGKTFIAGEVIRRAVEERRQRVLVLAPAALKEAMWEPFLEKYAFSRRVQAMSYDELRLSWQRDHAEVRRRLDDYAVVVVDEAHNLRNPQAQRTETVAALVGGAHPKQVILLTATPVNNSLGDLHALVSLFIRTTRPLPMPAFPRSGSTSRPPRDSTLSHCHRNTCSTFSTALRSVARAASCGSTTRTTAFQGRTVPSRRSDSPRPSSIGSPTSWTLWAMRCSQR